jgi:hypothetical protein
MMPDDSRRLFAQGEQLPHSLNPPDAVLWVSYRTQLQAEQGAGPADDLGEIKKEVLEGAMPLWNYRLLHWNAARSQNKKDSVSAWVDRSMKTLAEHGIVPKPKRAGKKEKEEGE